MGGGGEIYGESNIETYITICKIDSQRNFLHDSRNSNKGSVSLQRDGMGGRWEGSSRGRGHMYS